MAFWKKIFKSKYTGAEIDAAVAKAGDATKVTANPTLAGTEAALTGLEVGETKYKVGEETFVVNIDLTGIPADPAATFDKTYAEIMAAVNAGKNFKITVNVIVGGITAVQFITSTYVISSLGNSFIVTATMISDERTSLINYRAAILSNGTTEVIYLSVS